MSITVPDYGPYTIGRPIGKGSYGTVYLLIPHNPSNPSLCVKRYSKKKLCQPHHRKLIENECMVNSLLREAISQNAAQQTPHPGANYIMQLLYVEETSTCYHFVMPYAPGGDLFTYLETRKKLSESEAAKIVTQLALALDFAHRCAGVVHRDIKPDNILLSDSMCSSILLIDWGLSTRLPGPDDPPLSDCCGSPLYAAPELQYKCDYNGEPVDCWSTGIVLYALLTGTCPFDDPNNFVPNLYRKIRECAPHYPSHLSANAKDLLNKLIHRDASTRGTISTILTHPFITGTQKGACELS